MNASRSARNPSAPPFCTEARSPLERSSAAMEPLAAASRASGAPPMAMRMMRDATPLLICSSSSCWVGVAEGGRNALRSATTRVRASCQTLSARMTSQMATARRGRLLPVMHDRHHRAVAGGLDNLDLLEMRRRARQRNRVDDAPHPRIARHEAQVPRFARAGKLDPVVALELGKIAGDAEELVERRLHVLRQPVGPLVGKAALELERPREEGDMPGLHEAALARRDLRHLLHERGEVPSLRACL